MKTILKGFFCLTIIGLSALLMSCGQGKEKEKEKEVDPSPHPIHLSDAQRVFVKDNNAFTFNFIKAVNEADNSGKGFIYSPLSITYVLCMVNDAAEGMTRQELEQTLGFHEGGIQAVNEFCKTLIDSLPNVDQRVQLSIANSIFVNRQYKLKSQFQQDMRNYYDAMAESLDFSSLESVNRINNWCNDKTEGMIPAILEELNPDAVTYLLNAIYFKANWSEKFDESDTKMDTFTTANGPVLLPMMQQYIDLQYVRNDIFAAVDIPYSNKKWSMTVMLPEEGKTTDDIINFLTEKDWSASGPDNPLNPSEEYTVSLKLPRFETESSTDNLSDKLDGVLKKMGIRLVFENGPAEIPNMCEEGEVFISKMLQKARIKVNESGSEAAAVTVAEGVLECSYSEPRFVDFHADHPFVYVIREKSTGIILFVGKFTGIE